MTVLTSRQAARLLGVSTNTFWRMYRNGRLEWLRPRNPERSRNWVWDRDAVVRFRAEQDARYDSYYAARAAARALEINIGLLRVWTHRGYLRCISDGRFTYYDREEVARFADALEDYSSPKLAAEATSPDAKLRPTNPTGRETQ